MDIERRSQLRFDATALYSVTDQRTADQVNYGFLQLVTLHIFNRLNLCTYFQHSGQHVRLVASITVLIAVLAIIMTVYAILPLV
jgi:hypothetical protein